MCQACASALAAWEARALRSTDTSLPRSGLSVRVATLNGAYSTSIMTEAVEGGNLGGQFEPGPIEARSPSVAPAGDGQVLRSTSANWETFMVEGRKRSKKSTTNSRQDAPSSATSRIDFCCCWRERTSGVQAPPPLSGGDQTRRYLRLARPSRPPVDLCARITASGSLWRSFPTLWIANETVCEIQRGCIAYHNAMTCHADTRVCTYNYIMFDMGMSESETHQPDAQTRVRAPQYTSVAGLFLACINPAQDLVRRLPAGMTT